MISLQEYDEMEKNFYKDSSEKGTSFSQLDLSSSFSSLYGKNFSIDIPSEGSFFLPPRKLIVKIPVDFNARVPEEVRSKRVTKNDKTTVKKRKRIKRRVRKHRHT